MNAMLILTSLISIGLTGCLQTRAEMRGEGDKPLSEQTREHQSQQTRIAQNQTQVVEKPLPPKPAVSRLDEADEQLRQLSGRIDVVENQMSQLNAAANADKEGLKTSHKSVDGKLFAFEEALKKMEAQIQALVESRATEMAAAPARGSAKGPDTKAAAIGLHDEGSALFTGKKWKDAIVVFSKYRDQFPKGKKYADSTYKIGVCFQELGMKEEAKPFLEEVVAKFPGTGEAKKASYRLKTTK